MYVTCNNKIQNTPIWNEVKNWDAEDKRMLITLLYSTMGEEQKSEEDELETFTNEVSKDLLLQAGEYALNESRAGRCIPHAKAMQMIKERMGWK